MDNRSQREVSNSKEIKDAVKDVDNIPINTDQKGYAVKKKSKKKESNKNDSSKTERLDTATLLKNRKKR